jgi:hypothetical protein
MHASQPSDGLMVRRVIAIFIAGACLSGCSSFASFWSSSSAPPPSSRYAEPASTGMFDPPSVFVQLQLDTVPQGAEARTSLGPSCRTPCEIPLTNPKGSFSVTFTLDKYLPVTSTVLVSVVPSSFLSWGGVVLDPNPVVVELQPVPPPPPPPRRKMAPKKPAPPRTAVAPAAAPAAASPFPAPTR